MNKPDHTVVRAVHMHWVGELMLSNTNDTVQHRTHLSRGTYKLTDRWLVVIWDDHRPDSFRLIGDLFIHDRLIEAAPDLERTHLVSVGERQFLARQISLSLPGTPYNVALRLSTSDIATFKQVFVNKEYDSPHLPKSATAIIDLGANIGLSTVFFGIKYPGARILAVEPEEQNYQLLLTNTAALGSRVHPINAAAWVRDGLVNLHTKSEEGADLGAWGARVSESGNWSSREVRCVTPRTLLHDAGLESVDILKIDIEGAEFELFSEGTETWLSRALLIIIETHDRFRPGSDGAVRRALQPMFRELPRSGENLIFERIN